MTAFTGLVLAGGSAGRMGGEDKAWIEHEGEPFLLRVVRAFREAGAGEVVVASGTPERAAAYQERLADLARCVADPFPGEGPLSGIVAGLTAARSPVAVAAPVDAPLLSPTLVGHLVKVLEAEPHSDAVVPAWRGKTQPLNATFRRDACLPVLAEALVAGERMPRRAYEALRLARVKLPDEESSFRDVDTPDDLNRLRRGG